MNVNGAMTTRSEEGKREMHRRKPTKREREREREKEKGEIF